MTKDLVVVCQHCGKPNRFVPHPKPGQLAVKPKSTGRLSHLFENSVRSPFSSPSPRTMQAAAIDVPVLGNSSTPVGDWHRSQPVSKIDLLDILSSLADAAVIGGIFAIGSGGVLYAVDYHPFIGAASVGFIAFSVRYARNFDFVRSLTKMVESFTSDTIEIDVPERHKINVSIDETQGDGRHFLEDEISNPSISIDDLKKVAKSVYPHPHVANQFCVSRARIEKEGVSQDKARAILSELKDLNYCHAAKGNKTVLSLRGSSLFRKLAQNGHK